MKENRNRVAKLLMVMILVFCSAFIVENCKTIEVQAARTINARVEDGKTPVIKKRGIYNINVQGTSGFVNFKAPKKGTYTITVYNVRDWGKTSASTNGFGYYFISKRTKYDFIYPTLQNLKTNYGRTTTLAIASKWWYNRFGKWEGKSTDAHLYSRYAKIKLKKGETIFIRANWNEKFQYTLKIK